MLDLNVYNPDCRACDRLAQFLDQVQDRHPSYFCKPVSPFGDSAAQLLIVGLAPGLHGANATGRPFTGDWCSDLLYGTLHQFGFASAPRSLSRTDSLQLLNCRLTNAVKCLPPANKPTPQEIRQCSNFLVHEITSLSPRLIVCLGAVAHQAVLSCLPLKDLGLRASALKFAHGAEHQVGSVRVIDSYHPSRYNTNTGRLTPAMFEAIFARARDLII